MGLQSFNDPNSDEARQHLLDRRCERKHPKRHRTKKRSQKMREARKRKVVAKLAIAAKAFAAYNKRVQAYWAGEAESHPPSPR